MDIPDLYKRRTILSHKEGDIPKVITKTNASLIVTSARESLKQFQPKQMHFPAPRKVSNNKNISIAKLGSPCTPETKEYFTIDGITVARANSAMDNGTVAQGNMLFLEDLDRLSIPRRITIDTDSTFQQKSDKPEVKSSQLQPAKNSVKTFIIKHKRGNSGEMRKVSVSSTVSTEVGMNTLSSPSKPSTAEDMVPAKALIENSPVEIINEERKSECSSLSSNQAGFTDLNKIDVRSGESFHYTMRFGEGSSDIEVVAPREVRRRTEKSNTVIKKEGQVDFDVLLGEILGEGAYGRVYKALNLDTGKFLAVKEICPYEGQQKPSLNVGQLCQEIEVYQKLEHENIVRYLGAKQEEEDTYIYMEYMPGGSISSMLKQYGSFEEKVIKKFTKHVALGLHYLHTKGVIHRDIKGGNILSDGAGNVKLADFGAAKHVDYLPFVASVSGSEMCNSIKGSLYWMAPELINQKNHGRKIDIWSLGCTVIEMATASHPWPNVKNYTELVIAMMNQKCPPIPENLSEVAKDFIRQCCQFDKKLRPRIQDLLQHPFLIDS